MVHIRWDMNRANTRVSFLTTSGGNIKHVGWFAAIRGKNGRDWTRTNDLTDVNPRDRNHASDAILLVVESFNN